MPKLSSKDKEILTLELMEYRSNARVYRMAAKHATTSGSKRDNLWQMRNILKRVKALHKALIALGVRALPEYNYTGDSW